MLVDGVETNVFCRQRKFRPKTIKERIEIAVEGIEGY